MNRGRNADKRYGIGEAGRLGGGVEGRQGKAEGHRQRGYYNSKEHLTGDAKKIIRLRLYVFQFVPVEVLVCGGDI